MKLIILSFFSLFCLVVNCFSQSAETIKKINKLISPFYIMNADSLWNLQYGYYTEADLDGDHINEIVVSAIDTADQENKIFVFKVENGNFKIIDSSATYEVDGRGPHVKIKDDSLIIYHAFHHGGYDFEYKFNKAIQKFQLVSIGVDYINPNQPKEGYRISFEQEYDLLKRTLHLHSNVYDETADDNKEIKSKDTTIIENINLNRSLSLFIDPIEGNADDSPSSDYDSVFIGEGTVYDEMMNYK